MKNRIIFVLIRGVAYFFISSSSIAYADNVSRIARQDVNYSVYKSTGIVGIVNPGTSNVSISSGVIKIFGIYVSSPGVNSELRLYDNRLAGTATNQIGVSLHTNERIFIPVPIETNNGLVITSTAIAGSVWSQPSFNIYYIRVR